MNIRTLLLLLLICVTVIGGFLLGRMVLQPKSLPEIVNGSFEEGLTGWQSTGTVDVEGYDSPYRLTHTGWNP